MSLERDRLLNVFFIMIMSAVIVTTMLLFIRISDKSHPYIQGFNINDTYAPYSSWEKAR